MSELASLKARLVKLMDFLDSLQKDVVEEYKQRDVVGILHELFLMQHAIASVGKDIAARYEKKPDA